MNYLIYKITNIINGKIYVGAHKTDNIDDDYMGSGKVLKNAIRKNGIDAFTKEILHNFDSINEMFDMENEIVNEAFVKDTNTYNLMPGGTGSTNNWTNDSHARVIAGGLKGSKKGAARIKEMWENGETEHWNTRKGIQTTSTLGHKWYRNIETGERSMFINKDIPVGWITSAEYLKHKRSKMKQGTSFNQHWYNNGIDSFLRFEEDAINEGLLRGRLKTT